MSSSVALRIEGSFVEDMLGLSQNLRAQVSASKITPNHPPPKLGHLDSPFHRTREIIHRNTPLSSFKGLNACTDVV